MYEVTRNSIAMLREQMSNISTESQTSRTDVEKKFEQIAQCWDRIKDETQIQEREIINRLTIDHELKLNDIQKYLLVKNEEMEQLKLEQQRSVGYYAELVMSRDKNIEEQAQTIAELNRRITDLEAQIVAAAADKQKAVADVNREYKTEIESLRSRFKLMASMERSPSDTSLEKIERPDVMMEQTQDGLPCYYWSATSGGGPSSKMSKLSFNASSPSKNVDMFRQILKDKEMQLEDLRKSEEVLRLDRIELQKTIQSLADSEGNEKQLSLLRLQMDTVYADKAKLELELNVERKKRIEMESSVSVEKDKR